MGAVVVVMLGIGVYPKLLLDRVNPATDRVVARVVCADRLQDLGGAVGELAAADPATAPPVEGGRNPGSADCSEVFAPDQVTEEAAP